MSRTISLSHERHIHSAEARNAQAKLRPPDRTCPSHPYGPWMRNWSHWNKHQEHQHGKNLMLSNGWCTHQVEHMSKAYDLATFSYLASLTRSSHRLVDHTRCSDHTACIAFNTDPSSYQTRHAVGGCSCTTVSTPYPQLIKIIRNGGIPLISIESGSSEGTRYRLRLHTRSRASEYIAISHVWADGLGNPKENGLPQCQIQRLNKSIRALRKLSGKSKVMDRLSFP